MNIIKSLNKTFSKSNDLVKNATRKTVRNITSSVKSTMKMKGGYINKSIKNIKSKSKRTKSQRSTSRRSNKTKKNSRH